MPSYRFRLSSEEGDTEFIAHMYALTDEGAAELAKVMLRESESFAIEVENGARFVYGQHKPHKLVLSSSRSIRDRRASRKP